VIDLSNISVLCVDDDAVIRSVIRSALQRNGCRDVVQAHNGVEALDLCAGRDFDLVICDYQMAPITGLDLLRELARSGLGTGWPVIMLSAETNPSTIQEAQNLGVCAWVGKPVSVQTLIEQVTGVLPPRVHSAHISQYVEIHYRWHAFYGRKVRRLYAERRSEREIVVVETEPGTAIVLAAWMLDAVVCAAMRFGHPAADIAALADLHRLLRALRLRRTCSGEPSTVEEVHHAIAVVPNNFQQGTPSAHDATASPGVEGDDKRRTRHRRSTSCPSSDGSRRRGPRGDRR
jgi:CheY-like chemotaxis protein